jgi:hypothetical protein
LPCCGSTPVHAVEEEDPELVIDTIVDTVKASRR